MLYISMGGVSLTVSDKSTKLKKIKNQGIIYEENSIHIILYCPLCLLATWRDKKNVLQRNLN